MEHALQRCSLSFEFAALIKQLITRIKNELRARRAAQELHELPDYILADIGILRCEIESAVRNYSADYDIDLSKGPSGSRVKDRRLLGAGWL